MNSYNVLSYGDRQEFTAIEASDNTWELKGSYITRWSLFYEYFDMVLELTVPIDDLPIGGWVVLWMSMEDMNLDSTGDRTHKWESFSVAI